MNPETIPSELRLLDHWVCYRIVHRNGKQTKVPFQPSKAPASSTDPSTWSSFDSACGAKGFSGIGFVFTAAAGYVGIDLDNCRDAETGEVEEWARKIIDELDSYTELSQSGRGYHCIVKGELPPGANRRRRVEMYSQARYFVMTGNIQFGRDSIKHRDLADLRRRMAAGALEPPLKKDRKK